MMIKKFRYMPLWYKIWFFTVLFGLIYSVIRLFAPTQTSLDYLIRAYVGISLLMDIVLFPSKDAKRGDNFMP
jgi:hypothetical protein